LRKTRNVDGARRCGLDSGARGELAGTQEEPAHTEQQWSDLSFEINPPVLGNSMRRKRILAFGPAAEVRPHAEIYRLTVVRGI